MSADYGQTGIGDNVEFGKDGPRVKDSSGVVQFRNSADTALAKGQGADPTVDDDLATKRYVDSATGTSPWLEETATTTDATAGVTIATPIATLANGEQQSVEVLIIGEAGAANTYFRRQVFTFYRDGAGAAQWTTEINGTEALRGFGAGVTASLSTSGNAVLVTATGQASTTINWTVQYRTTESIAASGGGGGGGGGGLAFTATKTAAYTAASAEQVKYDPSGGTFTITMPASPSTDDQVGIKNASSDETAVTLAGNGKSVEDPSVPGSTSSSVSVVGAGISLIYQYDGTEWWIV